MKELLRTNDVVLLSYLEARLAGEGIETFILDMSASATFSSQYILPRRLMVIDDDFDRAEAVVAVAVKEADDSASNPSE